MMLEKQIHHGESVVLLRKSDDVQRNENVSGGIVVLETAEASLSAVWHRRAMVWGGEGENHSPQRNLSIAGENFSAKSTMKTELRLVMEYHRTIN